MHTIAQSQAKLSTWVRLLGIALFAVLTAISARLSVLLPFSVVPLTFQVLVVVLSGYMLGARDGLLSQVLYLQAILLGAPATAAGLGGVAAFMAPTAGYLVSFPIAAFAAGWLSHRAGGRAVLRRALGGAAALAIVYTMGAAWMSAYVGSMRVAWSIGVAPFVAADALKVVIAGGAISLQDR